MPRTNAASRVILQCAAGIGLCLATLTAERSSLPQQAAMSSRAPEWTTRHEWDDAKSFYFVGASRSAGAAQAREAAAAAAVERAVARIAEEMFSDRSTVSFYGLDALRQYVKRISTSSDWLGRTAAGGSGYEAFSLLELNKTFARPSTLRQYVSSTPPATPPAAIGYLLIPSTIGTSPTTRRVQVRAVKPRDGNFYFNFTVRRMKDVVSVRLDQIDVLDDGTPGRTSWRFDVAAGGRTVIERPPQSYDDDVATYRLMSEDRAAFDHPLSAGSGVLEIKITGVKTRGSAQSK